MSVEEPSKPNADETIEDLESSQIGESESSDESTTDEFPHFGEEAYDNMWQKTQCILAYVHDNYLDDYDYFWLGGDDFYLIVENLVNYLASIPMIK